MNYRRLPRWGKARRTTGVEGGEGPSPAPYAGSITPCIAESLHPLFSTGHLGRRTSLPVGAIRPNFLCILLALPCGARPAVLTDARRGRPGPPRATGQRPLTAVKPEHKPANQGSRMLHHHLRWQSTTRATCHRKGNRSPLLLRLLNFVTHCQRHNPNISPNRAEDDAYLWLAYRPSHHHLDARVQERGQVHVKWW